MYISNRIYYLLLIIPTCLLMFACQKNNSVNLILDQALNVMNDHPDSSLILLEKIENDDLRTKEHHARYALLYSQALDKNYIDLTNDSLIQIAVNYYKDKHDVQAKFYAYYYLGRVYTNANELAKAIIAYMEAEQLVEKLGNDYLVGLLYTQLGNIYRKYYDFPKALECYELATECYNKANRLEHKLYGMLSQSAIYKLMDKETDSFHILYNTLIEAKETKQTSIIRFCLGDLIMLCLNMDKQEEAMSFYNELINNYSIEKMTSSFYANLGLLMAKDNDSEKSQFYIEEAWKCARNKNDSINLYYILSRIEHMNSSYEDAYTSLSKSTHLQNSRIKNVLQQPILTAQKNFLEQEVEHKAYKLKMEKYIRLLGLTIILILSIIIILFLRNRIRILYQNRLKEKLKERESEYKQKLEELQKEALKREQNLHAYTIELENKSVLSQQDLEHLNRELEDSKVHIEQARRFLEQTTEKHKMEIESILEDKHSSLTGINKTLKKSFKQVENMLYILHLNYRKEENRDKAINEYIENTIQEFYGSKKADRNLEKMVNELYGNVMQHLRKEIHLPSEEHYKLVCLLLAGLSINFIASLSEETTNAIYKRREKIREIIRVSDSPYKSILLMI